MQGQTLPLANHPESSGCVDSSATARPPIPTQRISELISMIPLTGQSTSWELIFIEVRCRSSTFLSCTQLPKFSSSSHLKLDFVSHTAARDKRSQFSSDSSFILGPCYKCWFTGSSSTELQWNDEEVIIGSFWKSLKMFVYIQINCDWYFARRSTPLWEHCLLYFDIYFWFIL